jgi:hypothetical protein
LGPHAFAVMGLKYILPDENPVFKPGKLSLMIARKVWGIM